MRPRISIIVPCYNGAKYIRKTLECLQMQTMEDWECIIVDDGSTDSSAEIIKEFVTSDSRYKYIYKENGGVSSARNVGLDNASGEWVTFIDSDDTVDLDYFDIKGLDEVDFAVQRWRFTSENNTREKLVEGIYKGGDFITFMSETLHKDILRMVAAKFLRRDIIEKYHIRFDSNIRLGEDTIFMLEYYRHIKSVSVNNTSYYLYYRPDDWGVAKYRLSKEQFHYFYKKFFIVYSRLGIKSDQLISFIYNFYRYMLIGCDSAFSRLYVNTIPEYLKLNKKFILYGGKKAHFKYLIWRFISLFR